MAKGKKPSRKKRQDLFNDSWIVKYSVIDPKKEHALGVIAFAWNGCETQLLVLFMMVAKLEPHSGWIIAHDLGDISLIERIIEISKSRNENGDLSDEFLAAIRHALKIYDICRQNRNTFTHFKWRRIKTAPGESSG